MQQIINIFRKFPVVIILAAITSLAVTFLIPRSMSDSNASHLNKPAVLSETESIQPRGEKLDQNQPIPKLTAAINETGLGAKSILAFDLNSGAEIYAKNPTQQLPIASLTKLMTALVTYRNAKLDENSIILDSDRINVSPSLGLIAGDTVKLQDLFNAMLVGSDNDSALALANYVERKTGQKFITLMNEMAQQLSMNSTRFANPLGFDSSYNFSSSADLKLLVMETQQYTAFTSLSKTSRYSFKGNLGYTYSTKTTNKLIAKDKEIFAVKTGFTENAGGSMITKIEHDGHQIILIVIGSENREQDTLILKKEILKNTIWQ